MSQNAPEDEVKYAPEIKNLVQDENPESFGSIQPTTEQEKDLEKSVEIKHKEKSGRNAETGTKSKVRSAFWAKKRPTMPQVRDELTVKIEKILEDGLNDPYQRLSPIAKQEFKIKGEQTALKIRDLLKSTHVKIKKILKLILEWLRILPGVNRFFLEQEAKIKADKILALKK